MYIWEQVDDGWVEYRMSYNDRVCLMWLYESSCLFEEDDDEVVDDEDEEYDDEWQEWNNENEWDVGENEDVWNLIDWMNDHEDWEHQPSPPPPSGDKYIYSIRSTHLLV